MDLPPLLRLPRNFLFFSRLPVRFEATVLEAGRDTGQGRWFRIRVRDHELMVLSRENLNPGEILRIEKKSDMEMSIIGRKEAPVNEESSPATATLRSQDVPPQDFYLGLALALVAAGDAPGKDLILPGDKSYHFDLGGIKGAFVSKTNGYELLLSDKLPRGGAEMTQDLQALGIESVRYVPESVLDGLQRRVDLLS